jgi:hypothetical protein
MRLRNVIVAALVAVPFTVIFACYAPPVEKFSKYSEDWVPSVTRGFSGPDRSPTSSEMQAGDRYLHPQREESVTWEPPASTGSVSRRLSEAPSQKGEEVWEPPSSYPPPVAENGDIRGADNDGNGRPEPIYVRGYYKKDGTYVRGHYRARPRRK